jgi:hypothetical protein
MYSPNFGLSQNFKALQTRSTLHIIIVDLRKVEVSLLSARATLSSNEPAICDLSPIRVHR